MDNRELEGESN